MAAVHPSLERIVFMPISYSLSVVAFLAVAVGAAQVAGAASKPADRQTMEKAAKKACITGDVRKGIDLLGDLYVATNDIGYIYNQARCFEQNSRCAESIDRFSEYLRKATDLTAKERAEVDGHIAECEKRLAKQAPSAVAPAAALAPTPLPTATFPAASSVTTVSQAMPAAPAAEERSTSRLHTAGVVTASVGVLALAGGLVCNLKANSLTSDLNKPAGWDRGKASSRDTYETLGWVGYGLGVVAVATGATLFVLGGRSSTSVNVPPAVALTPVLLPGSVSLTLRGTY
jgi:hypothetical protein